MTQLAFHPLAPHILFVSFRRSPYIKAYDTRFLSSTRFSSPPSPSSLLATFSRGSSAPAERLEGHASEQETAQDGEANTHQRLSFDIDWAGRWLVAGSASGTVSAWKISGEPFVGVNEYQEAALKPETKEGRDPDGPLEFVKPYASWKAHDGTWPKAI